VTSLKIKNGGGTHPEKPYLERSSKYHVISIAKKHIQHIQYIECLSFRISPYLSINYQILRKNCQKPPKMTTPISQNHNDVFSVEQRRHLVDFELTRRWGTF
jgi:hypothetical protein